MTTEALYKELSYVTHSRENRLKYAQMLVEDPLIIPKALDILFMVNDKTSCRAAWVLEFMCHDKLTALVPHLDYFTAHIKTVHLDPAVRPVAKICEYLAKAFYAKNNALIKTQLITEHQERLIEVCFDYLISDQKIAPKAYAMNALYLFGQDYPWIHPELKSILERDYQMQSSGFKARAKHILKKIKQEKS